MKAIFFSYVIVASFFSLYAQTSESDWQAAAVAKYPQLGIQDTTFNKQFRDQLNKRRKTNPEFFTDPKWPITLADELSNSTETANGQFQEPHAPFPFKLQKPEDAFKDFVEKGHPKPRDQFETIAEYEARLPKSLDDKLIFYFLATKHTGFSYDIENKRLTISGGDNSYPVYNNDYHPIGVFPLNIDSSYEEVGTYEATNAYGKTITVKKVHMIVYCLHLSNLKELPKTISVLDKDSEKNGLQLALSIVMPREKAKETASRLRLVLGVKPFSYARSGEGGAHIEPKINDPTDLYAFCYGIEGQLVSLHIIDIQTNEELARWTP